MGAGVTGLAAGAASAGTILESRDFCGGICSSYYVRPGGSKRLHRPPADGEAFRFEIGGGHWIFGGDPPVLALMHRLVPLRRYLRRSAVYLPQRQLLIPYPIQNNLRFLGAQTAAQCLSEMEEAPEPPPGATMAEWLHAVFGPTLYGLFFRPFHELYTAGLLHEIAPQDPYKSPVRIEDVRRGALAAPDEVGYNVSFAYPAQGLDALAHALASAGGTVSYDCEVTAVEPSRRTVALANGREIAYGRLLSTLPLPAAASMTGGCGDRGDPDPWTSVLVLNIGAMKGARCPDSHWLYVPSSRSGFHRVGFYSNVDQSFLPRSRRQSDRWISIYVERAFLSGERPGPEAVARYAEDVVSELVDWGFIGEAEVVDPTWVDSAYTWRRPGSRWREDTIAKLEELGVHQVGRYGRWLFQGIADSIRDGLMAGAIARVEADSRSSGTRGT